MTMFDEGKGHSATGRSKNCVDGLGVGCEGAVSFDTAELKPLERFKVRIEIQGCGKAQVCRRLKIT